MIFKIWTADYTLTEKGLKIFNESEYSKNIFYKKNDNKITMNQSDATQIFNYPRDWVEKGIFEDIQNHQSKLENFINNTWLVSGSLVLVLMLLSSLVNGLVSLNPNIDLATKNNFFIYFLWIFGISFFILAFNFGLLMLGFIEAAKNEKKMRYQSPY